MPLLSLGAKRLLDDDEEEGLRDSSSQHYGDYTANIRLDARSVGSSSARSMLGYSSSIASSDFSWKDDTFVRIYLNHVAASIKKHVEVKKSRRYHASVYKDCFVASEAVDFLISLPNGVAPSRRHAVLLCQQLALTLQLFEHACEKEGGEESLKKEFADDYLFFHFVGMHSMGNKAFADVLRDYPDIGVSEDGGAGPLDLVLPQDWSSDDQWDKMSLAKLAIVLRQRVVIKDRRYRVSIFSKCFLGCEAVDVVREANPATVHSRQHALLVLRRLNKAYQVFNHVCGDHEIKDEALFYHFVDSRPKSTEFDSEEYSFFVQTESPWNGMTVEDLEGMVAELKAHSHDVTVDNNTLSYNHNRMIRQDGTVMNEDQIRDLRKRHGYCVSCPEDPIRLFVVRRSKFNPLYQKKEAIFVPGQSRNGVCLLCNPPAGSISGKSFKGKPRHSLVSIAKIVKNTNGMIPDGSMHSTQSHLSGISNQMSKRMPSSVSIQSQESSRSTVTTDDKSHQSGSGSDKESPVLSSYSSSSSHRIKTADHQLQTRHLSLLPAPKRHNSLSSVNQRTDLKRSNSVDGLPHHANNKSDSLNHERSNSDDGMLSLFVSPNTDTQARSPLNPAEESNYLHEQYLSKEDKRSHSPVSPTRAAMGSSVSSLECDAKFQALHTRRHMLAQAQKGDDLEQLMGAIRKHKARSPSSPRVDENTTTTDPLSWPKQDRAISGSSAAFKDGTSGGVINNDDGLPDSWIKLAQRTDDRLCALEAQVSLIVQQQNEQTLLMQQNTEMLQRLLAAFSSDSLSHSNARQPSPLPLSRNDVAWGPLSHSNTNAEVTHPLSSGMEMATTVPEGSLVVANTNSSAANAADVSKGPVDKLPIIRSPCRSHSSSQGQENTSAPSPPTKQSSQGDSRPTPSNPPEQIVSLPRRQSNQQPIPMGKQKTLDDSGLSGEPNTDSQLTPAKPPKQSASLLSNQDNMGLVDTKQYRKHPDPSALTEQQPPGQNSCNDIVHNTPESMMKQSDEIPSLTTQDASFSRTINPADGTYSLTTWSEEDGRDRKHKSSKKKKKKKEKRKRASESGHRTDESPGVLTSPDSHIGQVAKGDTIGT